MVRIGGIFGKITASFKANFLNFTNIIGNIFVVISGGTFLYLADAGLSNFGFYVKAKTGVQNAVGKMSSMLTKEA